MEPSHEEQHHGVETSHEEQHHGVETSHEEQHRGVETSHEEQHRGVETSHEEDPKAESSESHRALPARSRKRTLPTDEPSLKSRTTSPVPSCVSLKSDNSIIGHIDFGKTSDLRHQTHTLEEGTGDLHKHTLGEETGDLHKHTLGERTGDQQPDSYKPMDDALRRVLQIHKNDMKNKYYLSEGTKTHKKTPLSGIYTPLYIIEGESEGLNEEHDILQMDKTVRKYSQHTSLNCNDLFQPLPKPSFNENKEEKEKNLRTVLTKGIAGIGKTVSVQKFVLDWAEGKANQDIDFMFVLPFQELILIKDEQHSLHEVICSFHPELKNLKSNIYDMCKVMFIFDGLDESKLPLSFLETETLSDINMAASVSVLMSNLIKGDLLPSALIWITSRPAAANQIPPGYINRVTEIQGFSDSQKEEYFMKRIKDPRQVRNILSHIRKVQSLHIMCQIPVFCWILATVLQTFMHQEQSAEIPKTLTEMYIHFMIIQTSIKKRKYGKRQKRDGNSDLKQLMQSNKTMILKLAELAFTQLMKGNVMFYEEDLTECGIDVTEALVYSGICTEILMEESVLYQRKVYSFVHLSFQEFFAALHAFVYQLRKNIEEIKFFQLPMYEFLKRMVNKALQSHNGHLDLFLRFLLGISLESNQNLLQGLLPHTHSSSDSIKKTSQYIKRKIQTGSLPIDRSINLFHCLAEIKEPSLHKEIQECLSSETELPRGKCSALACMLLMSEEVIDVLDLTKYNTSEDGYRRLVPAVSNCRKALFVGCKITGRSCEIVASALQSENSLLRELDLSKNDLQDIGVEKLSAGLNSSHCKLEILRLNRCSLTFKSCEIIAPVLQLKDSTLRELDLSNNDIQDSGVKVLSDGLMSLHCKLEILRLSGCLVTEEGCSSLASALSSNPSHLKELDLTYNHPGESGEKLLKDSSCRLETLRLEYGSKLRIKPGLEKYVCDLTLDPNTARTCLCLSEGNRKVTRVREKQSYLDHPERFDVWAQVLCKESLSTCCYWEAELSGGESAIAMAYRGINRKGQSRDCEFGSNSNSWSLLCFKDRYAAWHDNRNTDIPALPFRSNRVGVYLDWPAGTLSFYSVSPDTRKLVHIHTFNSTFTEPLYAGFGIYDEDSSVYLCPME